MPDHAKTSGYIPEAVAKMLKAFDSHLWKATRKSIEKIEEYEYYLCE